MIRKELLGNLPLIESGPNKNSLNRTETCQLFGLTKEEIYKAYNNWIQIFRKPESTLTFEQYLIKMQEAGIRPFDLGNKNGHYQLARHKDIGGYTQENCRFITQEENSKELVRVNPYQALLKKYGS